MNKQKDGSTSSKKSSAKKSEKSLRRDEEIPKHPTEPEEDALDRTIEDSFPASDPPSSIPNPDEDAA